MTALPNVRAYARPTGHDARWHNGALLTFLATGADTAGQFSLIDELAPRGFAAPLHIHTKEIEAFYLVEGSLRVLAGDAEMLAEAGTLVVLPPDLPHAFVVESEQARFLNLVTPSGLEGFFRDSGEKAPSLTIPPPSAGGPDLVRLAELAARYGMSIIGPPPGFSA